MLDRRLEVTPVENNQTYIGFRRGSIKRCTEAVAGTKGCAEFEANKDGKVTVRLTVENRFLTLFERTFVIDSDRKFEFKSEDGRFSLTIEIKDFEIKEDKINFKLSMKFCVSTFCVGEAKFDISLPIPFVSIDPNRNLQQSDDLLLNLLLASLEEKKGCNCH